MLETFDRQVQFLRAGHDAEPGCVFEAYVMVGTIRTQVTVLAKRKVRAGEWVQCIQGDEDEGGREPEFSYRQPSEVRNDEQE